MSTAGPLGGAALATEYAEKLVLGTVRDVHGAVASRVHGALDLVAGGTTTSHRLHDGIARGVYAGVGLGLRASAQGLRAADRLADRAGLMPRLEDTPRGRFVLSAVNGLVGDRLREEAPDHSFEMGVRVAGRDVPLDPGNVAMAYPSATSDLVVFVHGLSESEAYWERAVRPRRDAAVPGYGSSLGDDGWSPVQVRVNTGLPIRENGAALASVMDRLVGAWPREVRRIALVGHSMGGLIVRAACAVHVGSGTGAQAGTDPAWTELVTDVVTLGTPHLGAPLERLAELGARSLGRLPESAPFARILEFRSPGILDLRRGLAADVQHLPHARYHLVAATLTRSPRNPLAETVGDLLVPYSSAIGRPRRGPEMFPGADVLHVPRASHFDLLNHDDVRAALQTWLRQDQHNRPSTRQQSAQEDTR